MKILNIKNVLIATGYPNICVPLTPADESALKRQLDIIRQQQTDIDLIEWRADYWKGDLASGAAVVSDLCDSLKKPLIFTIRTKEEGGEKVYSIQAYENAIRQSLKHAHFDLYDLQLSLVKREFPRMKICMDDLHRHKKAIILSYHDFHGTPRNDRMLAILTEQEKLGADMVKLAVMPRSIKDCERLMRVSRTFTSTHDIPTITISMGELGVPSRVSIKDTGSCITFAAAASISAPGQISASVLRKLLESHESRKID